MTPIFLSPKFWWGISTKIAVAPVEDLWNTVGTRQPSSTGPPVAPAAPEDEMAVAKHLKIAA